MSIPIEYGPAIVGVVFGVFALVLVKLDERRFDREMRDAEKQAMSAVV